MYEGNLSIDKPRAEWTERNIERLFIFCQLDRAMSYEKVCDVFENLEASGFTKFSRIRVSDPDTLGLVLKEAGHRFPRQTAGFLCCNAEKFEVSDLKEMTRDEIADNIKGFGYKLASMFWNRLHDDYRHAIIDVHVNRFLEERGVSSNSYKEREKHLKEIAQEKDMTLEELDWQIWNDNRIGNRQ